MEEIAARDAGAEESAEDEVVALIAAGLDEDEAAALHVQSWDAEHEKNMPEAEMREAIDLASRRQRNYDQPWWAANMAYQLNRRRLPGDPARVLREVAAKRAIIGQQTSDHAPVESVYGLVCRTCVDWQDAPWAEGGETEFGIAIPQAWPCGVARAVAASWPGRAEQKP